MNSKTYKPTHGGYPTHRRGAMWFKTSDWRKAPSYRLGDPDVIEELTATKINERWEEVSVGWNNAALKLFVKE